MAQLPSDCQVLLLPFSISFMICSLHFCTDWCMVTLMSIRVKVHILESSLSEMFFVHKAFVGTADKAFYPLPFKKQIIRWYHVDQIRLFTHSIFYTHKPRSFCCHGNRQAQGKKRSLPHFRSLPVCPCAAWRCKWLFHGHAFVSSQNKSLVFSGIHTSVCFCTVLFPAHMSVPSVRLAVAYARATIMPPSFAYKELSPLVALI